eukprot:1058484-Pleurochrysis_carterae.AAC.1
MPARSLASAASTWPCALPANRRPVTLGMAAKPGVRIARLFGSRAHTILNELRYHYYRAGKN